MAILEEHVLVALVASNIKYYEKLNYSIPRQKDKKGRMTVPKGTKILVKVNDLPKKSNVELTKICDSCGELIKNQTYIQILKYRGEDDKDTCNKCNTSKRINSFVKNNINGRSLAEVYPHLIQEWHPTKNGSLTPYNIFAHSHKEVWWLGRCGHEWKAIVKGRANGNGCKECRCEKMKGENHPMWKGGISSIHVYLRENLIQWKDDSRKNCNYRCIITGERFDTIHHLHGFDLILEETLTEINLDIREKINDYTEEELKLLVEKCIEVHYRYPLGVCLREDIHNLFHSIYKYGKNTPEQFEGFKERWDNGEFIGHDLLIN